PWLSKVLPDVCSQLIPPRSLIPVCLRQQPLRPMRTAFSHLFGQLPAILALHWSQQRSHEATGTSPRFGPTKMWPDALLHLGQFLDRLLEQRFFREVLPAFWFVRTHLLSLLASRLLHLPPKWGCSTILCCEMACSQMRGAIKASESCHERLSFLVILVGRLTPPSAGRCDAGCSPGCPSPHRVGARPPHASGSAAVHSRAASCGCAPRCPRANDSGASMPAHARAPGAWRRRDRLLALRPAAPRRP